MENPVIILGANNVGKNALDICLENSIEVFCFLDDDEKLSGQEISSVSILGSTDDENYLNMIQSTCEYFIASDNIKIKKILSKKLIETYSKQAVNIIHSSSSVSENAVIGHGNLIESQAAVKPFSEIGNLCNISSGAVIDSGAKIGDFVQIGLNSNLGSNVTVENDVFIGNGVTIVAGVTIGKGASIGAGSVVIANVETKSQVFGNPAKAL